MCKDQNISLAIRVWVLTTPPVANQYWFGLFLLDHPNLACSFQLFVNMVKLVGKIPTLSGYDFKSKKINYTLMYKNIYVREFLLDAKSKGLKPTYTEYKQSTFESKYVPTNNINVKTYSKPAYLILRDSIL